MKLTHWDKRFIDLANHIATWSKDTSTKVGCVIVDKRKRVVSMGYNGFPTGADDSKQERYERPAKYMFTEHAERNAIYSAASMGTNLKGTRLYVQLYPCVDCARAIIQSGITELVTPAPDYEKYPQWRESWEKSEELFEECRVEVTTY